MSKWSISPLELKLKDTWAISRGQSKERTNFLVEFSDDSFKGQGEVAFLTGQGVKEADIIEAFDYFLQSVPRGLDSLEELNSYLEENKEKLPANLRIALEQAFLTYICQIVEQDIAGLLGLKSCQRVKTSYSLPIMAPEKIEDFFLSNNLERFEYLKLKVNPSNVSETLEIFSRLYKGKLIVDANESFEEAQDIVDLQKQFPGLNIIYWEQPFKASNLEAYLKLSENFEVSVMADESITDGEITQEHAKLFQGVNIKLVKVGSFLKALKQIQQAKALGLEVMLGCMIESSLGISRALQIGAMCDYFDLDSFLLLEKDPFNLVYEEKGSIFQSKYQ